MDGLTFTFLMLGAVILILWGFLYYQEHRRKP